MDQNMPASGPKCNCPHHKMVPIFIILIGLSFLLTTIGWESAMVNSYAWPILLIAIGLQKIFEVRCSCCSRM